MTSLDDKLTIVMNYIAPLNMKYDDLNQGHSTSTHHGHYAYTNDVLSQSTSTDPLVDKSTN